ncbi:unnamed protein product [Urochloa decumbens]|uniref:F-box domain-containing protein n=1 Tax=Urochloa decumbens TaxID=240449 RepID=A0ABC8Z318_9POAL
MAAAGTDSGIEALPDDLLVEVFSRVGSVRSLFVFAVTSRRWLRLFTDPAFLRRLCPSQGEGHRARLLGFFPRQTEPFIDHSPRMMKLRMVQHTSVSPPTFVPAPGSPLGPTEERALTAFVSDDDGTFNYAEALAMRPTTGHLALCNPITGERHILPPLDCSISHMDVNGYAIVTAADIHRKPRSPSARFTFSQLLVIIGRNLHSYSAATRRWHAAPTMCLNGCLCVVGLQGLATVHRGAAHWLCFDSEAYTRAPRDDHKLYMVKLPVRAGGSPLLYVNGDGKLSIACLYPVHATVWTQQKAGKDNTWLRTQVFRLPMVVPNPNDPPEMRRCFDQWHGFDKGSMLVMYRCGGVFTLDVEEEATEKVMDCFPSLFKDKQLSRCVPYEMDLVDFFVSHLGGRQLRGVAEDNYKYHALKKKWWHIFVRS